MKSKKISIQNLMDKGLDYDTISAVLNNELDYNDYHISEFFEVLSALGVHLELYDLNEKSSWGEPKGQSDN
jgi:hypothetical protein